MKRHWIRNAIQREEDAIVNEELPLFEFERRVSNREYFLQALAEIEAKLGAPSSEAQFCAESLDVF